ncbi:NADP-dependent oxidoreductase [Streptomyces sp. NPDC049936]|uniref:NADP-dependent oxidoreductase n=1 Tax=Streptomyces sp. NPDC049936 TaxID=3365599 RepID=UPI003791FE4D
MLKIENIPIPEIKGNDILVRVHTAAVNPVDSLIRRGDFLLPEHRLPLTVGWDFAGTVVDVGRARTPLEVGHKVYGRPSLTRDGSYAEYIAVDAGEVARAPRTVPPEQAAGLPLATLTAWKALFDIGRLEAGQTVLIHAAAGGVGTMAVQLARHRGARVVATASSDGVDLAKSLGAHEVIDYTRSDFAARGRFADVVLDAVGGDTLERSYGVMVPGGTLITVAGAPDHAKARALGIHIATFILESNGPRLDEVADLVDAGVLRSIIARQFSLVDVREAHRLSETRRTRGKILLRIED